MLTPDQTRWHQAQLRAAIRLYSQTKIIPTRGCTITKLLEMTSQYTTKQYSRNNKGYQAAIADLDKLLNPTQE